MLWEEIIELNVFYVSRSTCPQSFVSISLRLKVVEDFKT